MIEHRRLRSDQHRMHMRQIGGAGRELDLPRFRYQRGQKDHAVGDVLAGIGEMLAHERVVKPEAVGEDDSLAVLLERLAPLPVHRVNRHGEIAQTHSKPSRPVIPGRHEVASPESMTNRPWGNGFRLSAFGLNDSSTLSQPTSVEWMRQAATSSSPFCRRSMILLRAPR